VFENRAPLRLYGPKRDDVTGEWRKLHNEELHIVYSSPNIIRQINSRRMRWAGHVARMGEERKFFRVLVGKPEGKIPVGRPRHGWEDGIRMELREIGCGNVESMQLAQGRDRWRDRDSIPDRGGRIFPLASVSRLVLGPTQPLYNGYRASFPRV
jgi:hypothetical protein